MTDKLERAVQAVRGIESIPMSVNSIVKSAEQINILQYISWGVVGVCCVAVALTCYFAYTGRDEAHRAYKAVINGVYKDGWSVINGAELNEYRLYTEEPEEYKKLYNGASLKTKQNYHYINGNEKEI